MKRRSIRTAKFIIIALITFIGLTVSRTSWTAPLAETWREHLETVRN